MRDGTGINQIGVYSDELIRMSGCGNQLFVECLLVLGADVNAINVEGEYALHRACAGGFAEIVRVLIDANADVDAENMLSQTPLHIAAECDNASIFEILTQNRANCEKRDYGGRTAVDVAREKNSGEVLKFISVSKLGTHTARVVEGRLPSKGVLIER